MNKMKDHTFESPFDRKWEMKPEDVAKVFSLNNKKEDYKEEAEPSNERDEELVLYKQTLVQNYLALMITLQQRLNNLYTHSEELSKDVYKNQLTALNLVRYNANTLLNLTLESINFDDVAFVKGMFLDLAKPYY